jgi:hypothetical protein
MTVVLGLQRIGVLHAQISGTQSSLLPRLHLCYGGTQLAPRRATVEPGQQAWSKTSFLKHSEICLFALAKFNAIDGTSLTCRQPRISSVSYTDRPAPPGGAPWCLVVSGHQCTDHPWCGMQASPDPGHEPQS